MSSLVRLYVQKFLTILLAGLILFVTIILTLFTLLLLLYRLLVWLTAKLFRPDLDTMVTGVGNVFLAMGTPERPVANLCMLIVVDGAIDLQQLRHLFQTRVINYQEKGVFVYQKLKQSVCHFMSYPFLMTDEYFDLKNHIRTYDYSEGGLGLPNPGRVTQQELEQRLPGLIVMPWKENQSNWEILLINDYYKNEKEPEKQTVVLFRMNHAVGDGLSLHKLLYRLLELEEPSYKFTNNSSGEDKGFMDKLKIYAGFPFKLFYDMAELQLDMTRSKSGWAYAGKKQLAVAAFPSAVPVDDIKAIKNELGVGYMPLLLTAMCAALGRLTLGTGRKARRIGCVVPLPKPNHPAAFTNHFYVGAISLPIVPEGTRAVVQDIQDNYSRISKSYAVLGLDLLLQMCSTLPVFVTRLGYLIFTPDVFLSIYPVPYETFHWEGSKVSRLVVFGAAASSSVGFGAAIFMNGVSGMQRVSIAVNKASFPCPNCEENLPYFDQYLREELQNLRENKCKALDEEEKLCATRIV